MESHADDFRQTFCFSSPPAARVEHAFVDVPSPCWFHFFLFIYVCETKSFPFAAGPASTHGSAPAAAAAAASSSSSSVSSPLDAGLCSVLVLLPEPQPARPPLLPPHLPPPSQHRGSSTKAADRGLLPICPATLARFFFFCCTNQQSGFVPPPSP